MDNVTLKNILRLSLIIGHFNQLVFRMPLKFNRVIHVNPSMIIIAIYGHDGGRIDLVFKWRLLLIIGYIHAQYEINPSYTI